MKKFRYYLTRNYYIWVLSVLPLSLFAVIVILLFGIKDALIGAAKSFYYELNEIFVLMKDIKPTFDRKVFEIKRKRYS